MSLSTLGFIASAGSLLWLSNAQSPAGSSEAVAAASEGRSAVLDKACRSDSGWARLIRDALRCAPSSIEEGYRDAAVSNAPAPEVARVHDVEVARLRRGTMIGGAGVLAMLASAAAMISTDDLAWIGAFVAVVATVFAWRIVVASRNARDALSMVFVAIPSIANHVEPPPPTRTLDTSALPYRFPTAGCFGAMLAVPALVMLLLLASDATTIVDAKQARLHFFTTVFATPLFFAVFVLFARRRIDLDAARAELVVTRSFLGITYTRTCIPIEIVRGFSTRGSGRSAKLMVDLLPMAAEVEIHDGYECAKAETALARVFKSQ